MNNTTLYMFFVFVSNFSLMSSFLTLYLTTNNVSLPLVSLLLLSYQVIKFLFEIPTGYLSDKFSYKVSSIVGLILVVFSYVFLLQPQNTTLLFISFICKGIGFTFVNGAVEAIYINSIEKHKLEKNNAVERVIFFSSSALSTLLGGFFIISFGYSFILTFDIFAILLSIVIVVLMKEKRRSISRKNNIRFRECMELILRNNTLKLLLLIDFATALSYIGVENFYAKFLEDMGLTTEYSGIIMAIQLIVPSLLWFVIPRNKMQKNRYKILLILPIVKVLLTLVLFVNTMPYSMITVVYIIQQTLFVIYAPIKYSLFQSNVEDKYRASLISIQGQTIALGGICFYILSGFLGKYIGISDIITVALLFTLGIYLFCSIKLNKILL